MRRCLLWTLFAAVMGFFVGGSFVAALQMPLPSRSTALQTSGTDTLSRFWHWTATDPLSFYTSVLALFTGVLSCSTIGLWLATNRNAKIAERALTEHERPWLSLESSTVQMRDPRTATVIQNNWFIKLHFKNVGRSPAIVIDCVCKIVEMSTLGEFPDYNGAFQVGVQRTISVGNGRSGPRTNATEPTRWRTGFFWKANLLGIERETAQYRLCIARCTFHADNSAVW